MRTLDFPGRCIAAFPEAAGRLAAQQTPGESGSDADELAVRCQLSPRLMPMKVESDLPSKFLDPALMVNGK